VCSFGSLDLLPDRNSAEVKSEESRVAAVREPDTSGQLLSQHWRARRLQRAPAAQGRDVDYVIRPRIGGAGSLLVLKLDGAQSPSRRTARVLAPSIRQIFPSDVAGALNDDDQRTSVDHGRSS
jgi:hypothetical protein